MIALDFFTQWMITASVGALCLLVATILGIVERRASRKRPH
jgi:hypothetical protein